MVIYILKADTLELNSSVSGWELAGRLILSFPVAGFAKTPHVVIFNLNKATSSPEFRLCEKRRNLATPVIS